MIYNHWICSCIAIEWTIGIRRYDFVMRTIRSRRYARRSSDRGRIWQRMKRSNVSCSSIVYDNDHRRSYSLQYIDSVFVKRMPNFVHRTATGRWSPHAFSVASHARSCFRYFSTYTVSRDTRWWWCLLFASFYSLCTTRTGIQ
jgi:hypothetical protein